VIQPRHITAVTFTVGILTATITRMVIARMANVGRIADVMTAAAINVADMAAMALVVTVVGWA
jgi:hypothetical protein